MGCTVNNCHNSIKLTLELENNGPLNFLDLVVRREEAAHSFGIFRKETATDILIPAIPITTLNVNGLAFWLTVYSPYP